MPQAGLHVFPPLLEAAVLLEALVLLDVLALVELVAPGMQQARQDGL